MPTVRNFASFRSLRLGISNVCAEAGFAAAACPAKAAAKRAKSRAADFALQRRTNEMVDDAVEIIGVAVAQPDDRNLGQESERPRRQRELASESGAEGRRQQRLVAREIERLDRAGGAGSEFGDDDKAAARPLLRAAPGGGGRDDQRVVAVSGGEIAERFKLRHRRCRGIGDDQRAGEARHTASPRATKANSEPWHEKPRSISQLISADGRRARDRRPMRFVLPTQRGGANPNPLDGRSGGLGRQLGEPGEDASERQFARDDTVPRGDRVIGRLALDRDIGRA